jgi:hypothetical protein
MANPRRILSVALTTILVVVVGIGCAVCAGAAVLVYRLVDYREQQIEKNLQTPMGLTCDGVYFGEGWGPRGKPSNASYTPDFPTISQKGQGALFVKIAGGPPIRLRNLKPEDVEQLDDFVREVGIESGVDKVTIHHRHQASHFEFQRGVLSGALIQSGYVRDLVFCDRTGANEFTLETQFETIAKLLGPENCELSYPERR